MTGVKGVVLAGGLGTRLAPLTRVTNKHLKPSGRGELEITDVNNACLKRGTLTCEIFDGWWTDAGTFESLYRANKLVVETPSLQ